MNDILFVGEHSRTFEVQWHSHEHWELVYCTGGVGVFQLESGAQIDYKAGEVVAIPPAYATPTAARRALPTCTSGWGTRPFPTTRPSMCRTAGNGT